MTKTGDSTRDRLLQAARDLFTTVGYHGATTPMIARRAGVAEGTIYRHFPSKKALYNETYQAAQRWAAASLRVVAQRVEQPVSERLADLAKHWLDQGERDPAMIRLLLAQDLAAVLDDASRLAAAEVRQGVERLIALGKQEGVIRPGVVELWAAIWLTLVGFAAEKAARREWTAQHPHAQATIDAAWEAIAWRPGSTATLIPATTPETED